MCSVLLCQAQSQHQTCPKSGNLNLTGISSIFAQDAQSQPCQAYQPLSYSWYHHHNSFHFLFPHNTTQVLCLQNICSRSARSQDIVLPSPISRRITGRFFQLMAASYLICVDYTCPLLPSQAPLPDWLCARVATSAPPTITAGATRSVNRWGRRG